MPGRNNPYTVRITETAWDMLIEHARFLANASLTTADRLIETFVETMDSLAAMPERNPWLEDDAIPFQKYRKLLEKHYLLLYETRGKVVYITAVVNCRQDYRWLIN